MHAGRFVVDTNTIVSRLLLPGSIPAQAVQKAVETGDLLFSAATLKELDEVLARPKFDRYLEPVDRAEFFRLLARLAVLVDITHSVTACRDPKDNKFLEVALNGSASSLITGDNDLLSLTPFRRIPILSPRHFLER